MTHDQMQTTLTVQTGRVKSVEDQLQFLIYQEPRLRVYLSEALRVCRILQYNLQESADNLEVIFPNLWTPLNLNVMPALRKKTRW